MAVIPLPVTLGLKEACDGDTRLSSVKPVRGRYFLVPERIRPPSPFSPSPSSSSSALSSRRALISRRASGRPHHLQRPFAYICIFPISSHLLPFHGKPRHMMLVLHRDGPRCSGLPLFSYSRIFRISAPNHQGASQPGERTHNDGSSTGHE